MHLPRSFQKWKPLNCMHYGNFFFLRFFPRFISHQEWPFSPHLVAQTTDVQSPQTVVTCKFFKRINLPVLILWNKHWETGKLHFPSSSLPTEWVTVMPDSELSERSQAPCNDHYRLAEAVKQSFILFLMFLLRFVPCKGWSLEDHQNAEGIIGACWGQEVELGQWAWWDLKLAPLCKHLTLWSLIMRLPFFPPPDPASFCAQNLL